MHRIRFASGKPIDAYDSEGVTIAPLTEPLARGAVFQAARAE
jgi:hypothetical protein